MLGAGTVQRYDGYVHFDYKPPRVEAMDGVWESARACMRNYLILREKVQAFRADPEVAAALEAAGVSELEVPTRGARASRSTTSATRRTTSTRCARAASPWKPSTSSRWSTCSASADCCQEGTTMPRPITLFTGQWADLPFEEVARLASEWGYDGLEIACWGDHLDPWQADDDAYVQGKLDLLEKYGLSASTRSPTTSRARPSATTRSTPGTRRSCRRTCGATATPRASGSGRPRR